MHILNNCCDVMSFIRYNIDYDLWFLCKNEIRILPQGVLWTAFYVVWNMISNIFNLLYIASYLCFILTIVIFVYWRVMCILEFIVGLYLCWIALNYTDQVVCVNSMNRLTYICMCIATLRVTTAYIRSTELVVNHENKKKMY